MWSVVGSKRLVQRASWLWSSHGFRFCATSAVTKQPSKVLHIRTTGDPLTEDDLLKLTRPFGSISKFIHLRTSRNQTLLEMQDVSEAVNIMQHYSTNPPCVRGDDVLIQYSSHQELIDTEKRTPSKVLLVTIHNPLYQITVDVLEKVFKTYGDLEKIVIFQRAGLQALIQLNSEDSASKAKNSLNGRQIYDGCCQLDIQYSKSQDIDVKCNNEYNRDFLDDSLPKSNPRTTETESLLGPGRMYSSPAPHVGSSIPSSGILPPGITGTKYKTILLVTNFDSEKIDETKLFNLFSGYGKILRIKMFANRSDQALVQLGDGLQAELAHRYLQGTVIYGRALEVSFSRNTSIDHPDSRNFATSPRNRFNPDYVKHCCAPTRIVHVSNIPPEMEQGELISLLAPHGVILNMKLWDSSSNARKQALCEFTTVQQATEALMCKHLTRLKDSTIRLAFSRFQEIK